MQNNKKYFYLFYFLLILFLSYTFFSSFATCTNISNQNIPSSEQLKKEDYINFTYIIENDKYTAIKYPVSNYLIKSFDIKFFNDYINKISFDFTRQNPSFLINQSLSFFEKCDVYNDISLYFEVNQYFSYLLNQEDFVILKNYLEKYINEKPPIPYPIELGDFINMYQNGIEYRYPLSKGATIIEYIDKSYQIKFEDGRNFFLLKDGTYFETTEDGSELYFVNPSKNYFRRWFGGVLLVKTEKSALIQFGVLSISFNPDKINTIEYKAKNNEIFDILLINKETENIPNLFLNDVKLPLINDDNIFKLIYTANNKFQIIKDIKTANILFKINDYLISIQKNFIKTIYLLSEDNKIKSIISFYLPEGIKIYELDSTFAKSEVNLAYNFKQTNINGFTFHYPDEISSYITNINEDKLKDILSLIKERFGWEIYTPINVIIPSNIYQYQALLCGSTERKFEYLPDGFTRDDVIICWPFDTPRYYEDKEMSYFFEKEFYTILLYQVTKKLIYQQIAFFSRLPYFIEVGIPAYLATLYDEDLANSYDSIFSFLIKNKFPIDKELLVLTNAENTQLLYNKYLCAISYKLVKYLISVYGQEKLTLFIRSFKLEINMNNINLLKSNKDFLNLFDKNIIQNFGTNFQKIIEAFLHFKN